MTQPTPTLSPASQKLLREIARRDTGHGVAFKWAGRGRYLIPGTGFACNQRTFYPLTAGGLVTSDDEDAPVRITEAGRKLAAELNAAEAAKSPRPKPSADGPTARCLLREIAKHDKSLIYDDGRRRVWAVAARDGHRASIDTWMALEKAGRIRIDRVSSIGGQRVSVTDAGRECLGAVSPAAAGGVNGHDA